MILSINPLKDKLTHPALIMDRSQSNQILLIADANPENVKVLKTILAPDYDLTVATQGQAAIRIMK